MGIISWPPPAQTHLPVHVSTDGLPGVYPATVRLGRAELFNDGWQPMLDPAALRMLLADLAGLGDEPTQLARLGWTLHAAGDDQVELIEANLPAEPLDQVDGRWRLPRECGFTVVDELPPLAQLYRSLTLLEAHAYGPTDQIVDPADLHAQAHSAARALGTILGALIGLAVDTDADTAHAALIHPPCPAAGNADSAAAPQPAGPDEEADPGPAIRAIVHDLVAAAAHTVTAYLPAAR
jgi:hypothetical protein